MAKAFVAGATGYTGQAVVKALLERGVEPTAHVRPDSSSLPRWRETFAAQGAAVDTTPWEELAMTDTLARLQPALVFALLGTTRKRASGEGMGAAEAYERVDYGLTALLLRATIKAEIRPRFIYLSALGASATSSNDYIRARGRVEAELIAIGLPYTIARPSFITGEDREEDRPMERIAATVADGALGLLGALGARRLRDTYSSLSASQLARGLVGAALDPACEGAILDTAALRAQS